MSMATRIRNIVRPFARKGWGHWLRFALLLTGGVLLGHVLNHAPWLTQVRYSIYHREMMMRDQSQLYPKRTALVLLNDDDYWGDSYQSRTPLKRDVLADLLDKLDSLGVNTVAFDVDLRSPRPADPNFEFSDYQAEDAKLVAAIERMCKAGHHVVLASSIQFGADGYSEMPSIYSAKLPQLPCVKRGYIQLPYDMRTISGTLDLANGGQLDSMPLAVTGIADPTARAEASANTGQGFRFSEYLDEADFGPKNGRQFIFSGNQIMETDPAKLKHQLADKLVFVGAKWHADAYGVGPLVDQHNSPGGMEPGVMLHANYVEAILDRTGTFAPVSDSTAEIIEVGLVLALALVGLLEIHALWKWAALAIGLTLSLLLTYTLLQNLGLFLDFLVPLLIIVFHTLGEEVLGIWHEFRDLKRQHLKRHAEQSAAANRQEVNHEISAP
jgi:CHASE2 domain-containing sensor protein